MATANAGSPEEFPIKERVTISPVLCSSFVLQLGFCCKCTIYKFLRCYMLWVCEDLLHSPAFNTAPCSITATRSHIRWMTFISCVINKIVIPISSLIFNNRSRIESVVLDLKHSLLRRLITLPVHVIVHGR